MRNRIIPMWAQRRLESPKTLRKATGSAPRRYTPFRTSLSVCAAAAHCSCDCTHPFPCHFYRKDFVTGKILLDRDWSINLHVTHFCSCCPHHGPCWPMHESKKGCPILMCNSIIYMHITWTWLCMPNMPCHEP